MAHMAATKDWTIDDARALPDDGNRYEVIDGELFVTPAPSLLHQHAVTAMLRLTADYVDRERVGAVVVSPADVVFSPRRAIQPDVFVTPLVDGKRPRHFDEVGRLLLAIEVLSPSTARVDRVKKRALLRSEGVPEYWVVDLDARVIERSTPDDGRVEVLSERLSWTPDGASSPFTMDVARYFEEILER